MSPSVGSAVSLPVQARMFIRLFALQGAWNYETLCANGIGFCIEPALRQLPGGRAGNAYREALARQSQYFNAHPYLAAMAVGALARAELDGAPAAQIVRFRTAICGPLGSVGDRLVWAAWLPFCSLLGLVGYALGLRPLHVVGLFALTYNAGHVALRLWAFRQGLTRGLNVAPALGHPLLRTGPLYLSLPASLLAGAALPLLLAGFLAGRGTELFVVVAAVAVLAGLLVRAGDRMEGWKFALGVLFVFVLFAVAR